MLKQKRVRGRLKKNWVEGIRKALNERNLNEGQWEDGKQWSLGVGQRRTAFWNRYTHIIIILYMFLATLCSSSGGLIALTFLKSSGFFTYHQVQHTKISTWCSLCVECFVRIWEQTGAFALYVINWLVFIAVVESVYSAVRTGSLNKAVCASSVKG